MLLNEGSLIGAGPDMRRTRTTLEQLACHADAALLLVGEFGTGKRHCARALHAATFPAGEFFELEVDGEAQLERRIHELRRLASAPTAAGLTVFVHELSELPAPLQLVLAELLSEGDRRFRLVVSSSRALSQAAREGLVQSELAFGFAHQLELPPLRDRLEDLAELVRHFAGLAASRRGSSPTLLGPNALQSMRAYTWPGNLTELSNVLEQLTQNHGSTVIAADDLPEFHERSSGVEFRWSSPAHRVRPTGT